MGSSVDERPLRLVGDVRVGDDTAVDRYQDLRHQYLTTTRVWPNGLGPVART